MNLRHYLSQIVVSKRTVIGLILLDIVLAVAIFLVISSFFRPEDKLAYLSVISGDVKVSDGITEIEAKNGDLTARKMRTLVKTGQGIASLKLQDGSIIIIDESSIVEFNRYNDNDPRKSFALNLVKGRLLVINENGSQSPTQILIGGDVAVRISDAVMGLEINMDDEVHKRVDCLLGQCLVNGSYLLSPGQNAQIKPGESVQVIEGVPYETWISLGRASDLNPVLSDMFANIIPTKTSLPTSTPKPLLTPSPSHTISPTFTRTATLMLTDSPTPTLRQNTTTPTKTPTSVPLIPTNPQEPPTEPPPPTVPPPPPVVIESCEVDPSTVPIGVNVTITFIVHFSSRIPGYGFDAEINANNPEQSGCSGTDNDGDGVAYCDGSSGVLPGSTTVNVTFKSSVGDCVASYSSR